MTHPRAKTIIARCHQQGVFLRKAYVKRANGRGLTEYTLEPGGTRVREKYALEAIRSGFLAVRDNGLLDDDPQTWTVSKTAR
jgi:hypothetical protein